MQIYELETHDYHFNEGMMVIANTRSVFSRDERMIKGVMTKQSRSKYRPHYGAKEAAKYAGRESL